LYELLDIVDAHDRVIGCATRAEIHRTQRLHRAVHMLVFSSAGDLYLQKRVATKDMYPNCWDSSAAGHVDHGEDYLDCAVREINEELGLDVVASDFTEFMRAEPIESNGYERQRFYSVISNQPVTPNPDEIAEGRWLSPTEMDAWVASDDAAMTPDLKQAWAVYRGVKQY